MAVQLRGDTSLQGCLKGGLPTLWTGHGGPEEVMEPSWVSPSQAPPVGPGTPAEPAGRWGQAGSKELPPSPALLAAAQNFLQKKKRKKGPWGMKLPGPTPSFGRSLGRQAGLSHSGGNEQPNHRPGLPSPSPSLSRSFSLPFLPPSVPPSFPFFLSGVKNSWKLPSLKSPSLFSQGRHRLPTTKSFCPRGIR